jgi:hypothetical protein
MCSLVPAAVHYSISSGCPLTLNIFEGFMEAAGRNPAAFNKFNNDFLGSSQYLFVDGRHVTAPLTRISLSASPIRLPSLLLG